MDDRRPSPGSHHSYEQSGATAWLEVIRGKTLYPRRPLENGRCLIGAGSNCQIQLGGEGIPFLHSMIVQDESGLTIEAFVPSPKLEVNDEVVESTLLRDGDTIRIGTFMFRLHAQPTFSASEPSSLLAPVPLDLANENELDHEEDLTELSVAELIDRLEAAEEEVELGRQQGLAAMLDAAWLAEPLPSIAAPLEIEVEEAQPQEVVPAPQPMRMQEELVLEDLLSLAEELEGRLAEIRARERLQAEQAASLLAAQAELAQKLQTAVEQLDANADVPVRASA